jgi:NAD(P)H-dependent flavin oxidoreductase YrpB (nitropropane dioxygenase family)
MHMTSLCHQLGEETVYTRLFDVGWPDAPHRVLRNKTVVEWEAAGRPSTGRSPSEGTVVGTMPVADTLVEVVRYAVFSPKPGFTGDLDSLAPYAGESCSLVHDSKPAAQIVRDVMRESAEVLAQLASPQYR